MTAILGAAGCSYRESHHFSLATILLSSFVLEETCTSIVNRLNISTKPRTSILAREVTGLSPRGTGPVRLAEERRAEPFSRRRTPSAARTLARAPGRVGETLRRRNRLQGPWYKTTTETIVSALRIWFHSAILYEDTARVQSLIFRYNTFKLFCTGRNLHKYCKSSDHQYNSVYKYFSTRSDRTLIQARVQSLLPRYNTSTQVCTGRNLY